MLFVQAMPKVGSISIRRKLFRPTQVEGLYAQHVGEATYFLNGVALTPTELVAHAKLDPRFYSWMPPKQGYFSLPLRQGENSLVIITRPDKAIGWWGVGATVFDKDGHVLT